MAEPEASQAWRQLVPVWHALICEMNSGGSAEFARYIADDQRRAVERSFALAEVESWAFRPIAAAEIAGRELAHELVRPHRDSVTGLIGHPPGATTLTMQAIEAGPDEFDTIA